MDDNYAMSSFLIFNLKKIKFSLGLCVALIESKALWMMVKL